MVLPEKNFFRGFEEASSVDKALHYGSKQYIMHVSADGMQVQNIRDVQHLR